jgi:hypothetical protein
MGKAKKESPLLKAVYHEKRLTVIFAALFALSLLPLLVLAFYNHPGVDDFANGAPTRAAYLETHSIAAVIAAAARFTVEVYDTWQGSYAAQLLFSLHPAFYLGEGLYSLTTFVMLSMLIGATFFFLHALIVGVLGLGRQCVALVALPLLFVSIQSVPYPVESFYWYTGSMYYTFFHGLLLFLLGLCLRLYQTPPSPSFWRKTAFAALLCVAIGGGNLVTGLAAVLLLLALTAACFFFRRPLYQRIVFAALLLLLLAAFLVNVAAPGNAVRQDFVGDPGANRAVTAILLSLYVAVYNIPLWLDWRVLSLLLFLAPAYYRMAGEIKFSFKYPLLVAASSFLLYAAMYAPTLYALGYMGPGRVRNIIYYALLLLVFLNYIYLLGWLARRPLANKSLAAYMPYVASVSALVFLLASLLSPRPYVAYTAAACLLDGSARQYSAETKERYRILHDDRIKQVHLAPLSVYPELLFLHLEGDLSTDPDNEKNRGMAAFYQKEYVVLDGGFNG